MIRCIVMDEKDDMATVLEKVAPGDTLEVLSRGFSQIGTLSSIADIPFAHKVALRDIAQGETVKKCGEIVGKATKPIPRGDYLHVHNIVSIEGTARKEEKA